MKPERDNAGSFREHAEEMKTFRQSHGTELSSSPPFEKIPPPLVVDLTHGERLIIYLPTPNGKLICIPIWKIPVPPDYQN
jgi:hypothetical protein